MAHCKVSNSDVELGNYFNISLKIVANFMYKIKISASQRTHCLLEVYKQSLSTVEWYVNNLQGKMENFF